MSLWDRVPHRHLIDRLLYRPDRCWLLHELEWIAATTHMPNGTDQPDGATRWERTHDHPATMSTTLVRVVLGTDGRTIVTAIPIRTWKS